MPPLLDTQSSIAGSHMFAVLNSAEVRSHSVGIKGDLRLIDFTWFFCSLGVEVAVFGEVL